MNSATYSAYNEMPLFPRLADSRRVLVVALIKLFLDGILFFLILYSPLHRLGVFRYMAEDYWQTCLSFRKISLPEPSYSLWFFTGLLFATVLYLYSVYIANIRKKVSYLMYAGLFGIDVLFVIQPSNLLFTVLLCALLLTFLRIGNPIVRYSLCGATVLLYGLLVTYTGLLLIPVYLVARLWQKNDTNGIRVCVLLMLLFCLLYQAGVISKIYELHPSIITEATYKRRFPDENYMGHVSYYLVDTVLILLRILFPFDALFASGSDLITRIYAAAQLVTIALLYPRMRHLLQARSKRGIGREDRMQSDVFIALGALACSQCFTAKEPIEALRYLSACYPLLYYLMFTAGDRVLYPQLQRDLSGTCPVVFCHRGGDDYLHDVLQRAGRSCGYRNIVLLGDEDNRGFLSNWVDIATCNKEETTRFRALYRPYGDSDATMFDLICLERHFALYGFMKDRGIDRCFLCDSDVLVYGNLCELPLEDADFACTGTASAEFLKENVSPHCAYWTIDRLRQFLDFVLYVYRSNTEWLKEVCRKQTLEGTPSRITDTVLLTAWCKIVSEYDKDFRYRNLCEVKDGVTWDYALSTPDNLEQDEYRYNRMRQTKDFRFRKHIPYFTKKNDGNEVAAMCLHLSHCSTYTPLLLHETGLSFLYLFNHLMYRE